MLTIYLMTLMTPKEIKSIAVHADDKKIEVISLS